jgi:LacI family transcriptional regulator
MSRTAVELLVHAIRMAKAGRSADIGEPHVLAAYTLIRRQSDAAPRRHPATQRARTPR